MLIASTHIIFGPLLTIFLGLFNKKFAQNKVIKIIQPKSQQNNQNYPKNESAQQQITPIERQPKNK